MSPDGLRCSPLLPVDVPAGADGVAVVADALRSVLGGGSSVALLPRYAPRPVYEDLRARVTAVGDCLAVDEPALVCPTSGSTGRPSLVVLPRSALVAAATARDTALGGPSAWFIALPPVTAATMIAVTRAVRAATPVWAWPGAGRPDRFDASSVLAAAAEALTEADRLGRPLRTSLVNRQLAVMLDQPQGAPTLARFDHILVGGGPLPVELLNRARAAGLTVVTTYGQTETCGGCVYDGVPSADCQVVIDDRGEILVSGPCVASGYLDGVMPAVGGMVRTGDRGRWRDGRLEVLGRFDDVVTVGGANVDLAAVTAAVRAVTGVSDAAVVAQPDPAGGHRIAAFVTGDAQPAAIRRAVAEQLGRAAVPRVQVLDELPRLPGGKTDLRRLTGCLP